MPRYRRILVSAFIIVHLAAILSWSLPFETRPTQFVKRWCAGYLLYTGLWQAWDMFAPDPRRMLLRMDATVKLRDGRTVRWAFPQMDRLGVLERFQKERYRKWAHDNVRLDAQSGLWEPTAKYVARRFKSRNNPPVTVELYRHWAELAPPERPASNTGLNWRHYMFYRKQIAAGEL